MQLQAMLQQLGYETDSVIQEGLAGCSDERFWQAAQETGRFLTTQDLDFSDIKRFKPADRRRPTFFLCAIPYDAGQGGDK
jgi:predicted nuclease of predicted toxin-antitoxin system